VNTVLPSIKRLEFVASSRIYITPASELVIPIGNCRVYAEDEQAREFLNDLLSLAGKFKAHEYAPVNAIAGR
jgi:hypothetical protein